MTKQTIEVEVPEGWRVKAYRMPNKGDYFWHQNRVCVASSSFIDQRLIIEKIPPRRIVLESTGEKREPVAADDYFFNSYGNLRSGNSLGVFEIWREVKEIAIPLNNDEPKLELSVAECKEAMRKLETFNVTDLSVKICRFLKDK